ncbi:MAG TPA: hypothetical protein ENN87_10300 [Phycisphaerales bacterium]|nr:hypothetical protein [Phycisphaerales bacterium]
MAVITKELAERIAHKLDAQIVPGGAHDIARVVHDGRLVAFFGIRRGSKKDAGHDHIPSQVFLNPSKARLLGQCPLSKADWIRIIREKGKLS